MITLKKLRKKTQRKNTFNKYKTPYWLSVRAGFDLCLTQSFIGEEVLFLSSKSFDTKLAEKIIVADDYPVTNDQGIKVGKIMGVTVRRVDDLNLMPQLDLTVSIDKVCDAGKRLIEQINRSKCPFSIGVTNGKW